ncbi:himA: integration host factor, alpha subunit [Solimicrobium silvestre]|uniref:Integration host factor subunit alpha n=2 Tax=Solimicrobium silvestre TaxID=2099400 RepID=A0A2S9GX36_9BURK|nr:himA: integration host factor, alpha subunit [Solimicrobium silvestre]
MLNLKELEIEVELDVEQIRQQMKDETLTEPQSELDANLNRAKQEAQARMMAAKQLTTLTKAELAELLFEQVGLNKREAKDMVETFFDEIRNALERGEAVKLSGFGNFQLRDKPQRPGRNPKTGEEIPISARRVVTFHASQKMKSMVDQLSGQSASSDSV